MKDRSDLVKNRQLVYSQRRKIHETPSDTVVALYILFLLAYKPCKIQYMTIWSQQLNSVIYYRWILGYNSTLDYFISVDTSSMLEDT